MNGTRKLQMIIERGKFAMPKILIIDDDEMIRDMLRQMLESNGYEVEDASNGTEALKKFKNNGVDLIITDIIMPEKEGIETIIEFRQLYPTVKIIAMSGGGIVGPESYLRIAKTLGADMTFSKPIDKDDLLAHVKAILTQN